MTAPDTITKAEARKAHEAAVAKEQSLLASLAAIEREAEDLNSTAAAVALETPGKVSELAKRRAELNASIDLHREMLAVSQQNTREAALPLLRYAASDYRRKHAKAVKDGQEFIARKGALLEELCEMTGTRDWYNTHLVNATNSPQERDIEHREYYYGRAAHLLDLVTEGRGDELADLVGDRNAFWASSMLEGHRYDPASFLGSARPDPVTVLPEELLPGGLYPLPTIDAVPSN